MARTTRKHIHAPLLHLAANGRIWPRYCASPSIFDGFLCTPESIFKGVLAIVDNVHIEIPYNLRGFAAQHSTIIGCPVSNVSPACAPAPISSTIADSAVAHSNRSGSFALVFLIDDRTLCYKCYSFCASRTPLFFASFFFVLRLDKIQFQDRES